ncbi:hypothetical protein [Candidatus Mesenet endosymbiont of Phosphuga atrata]|uniref:hypothetical protein n=1 Tax=Candidatus Mesenet endosymbiont of Phosphuga atrata TaxID=3066221 RepID=UPI0030CF8E72
MSNQALKLVLKKNQKDLIFAGVFITGIILSGIGLFGSGETNSTVGFIGLTLFIPLFFPVIIDTISHIDTIRNEADIRKRDIVGNIFSNVAVLGGIILTGVSLCGQLDDNAKFITGVVGFTLLLSSLLCLITHRVWFNRDEHKSQKLINDSFESVNSKNGINNEDETHLY